MHRVTVVDVLSGNTIAVWPQWTYCGESGSLVRIRGLRTHPEESRRSDEARCKLLFLMLGSDVYVMGVHGCTDQVLVCDVHYCGRNLTKHLPEFAVTADGASSAISEALLGALPGSGAFASSPNGND